MRFLVAFANLLGQYLDRGLSKMPDDWFDVFDED